MSFQSRSDRIFSNNGLVSAELSNKEMIFVNLISLSLLYCVDEFKVVTDFVNENSSGTCTSERSDMKLKFKENLANFLKQTEIQ